MYAHKLILALCLTLFPPLVLAQRGSIEMAERIGIDALNALWAGQFAQLNAMAGQKLKTRERLPDGLWTLTFVTNRFSQDLKETDEAAWPKRLALMDKWIATTPDDPTPYIAKAGVLVEYAWIGRGRGLAKTVTPEGWKLFAKRLAEARAVLEGSAAVSKSTPVWFETMQRVAKGQSWSKEDYLKLFDEGVSREPGYYILYFEAASYLLPRWKGSPEELTSFVDQAVKRTRADEGETLYARIYWSLGWELRDQIFAPGYAQWPRMKQGFLDMVKSYPEQRNKNAFAYYACKAADWETAKEVLPQLTGLEPDIWETEGAYKQCFARVFNK
jgi:hypothetical protein